MLSKGLSLKIYKDIQATKRIFQIILLRTLFDIKTKWVLHYRFECARHESELSGRTAFNCIGSMVFFPNDCFA